MAEVRKDRYPVAPPIGHAAASEAFSRYRRGAHSDVQAMRISDTSEFLEALRPSEVKAVFAYAAGCMFRPAEGGTWPTDSYQTAIERACNALADGVISPKEG